MSDITTKSNAYRKHYIGNTLVDREGDLRVWWIAQVPGPAFVVKVGSVDAAIKMLDTLAAYDAFQFKNKIKGDYCNVGGLAVFEDGEWSDWCDRNGRSIRDARQFLTTNYAIDNAF